MAKGKAARVVVKVAELEKVAKAGSVDLFLVKVDGAVVGMVERPKPTKTDRSYWRAFAGVGVNAQFIGHAWERADAVRAVVTGEAPQE